MCKLLEFYGLLEPKKFKQIDINYALFSLFCVCACFSTKQGDYYELWGYLHLEAVNQW